MTSLPLPLAGLPTSPPPTLRPYQEAAVHAIAEAFDRGRRSPLLVLPTGAGKTVVAAQIIRQAAQDGRRAMFIAPRRELVHQASRALDRVGVAHSVLLAGDTRQDLYAPVQVASLDTLIARLVRRNRMTLLPPHLIVVDEAHLSITDKRQRLFALWPDAQRIGLTATPTRKDGRALGAVFDELIEPVTTHGLTADQHLVPARYFSVSEPDLSRLRVIAGDYHAGELEAVVNRPELVGDIVDTWLARAGGRRTVVFATSIEHSAALEHEFRLHGVAVEHVDANTPPDERDAIFARLASGQTQVLTNCFLASYGFDLPELACVVLARPTRSLMLYLQMIGRGLRTAPGKSDCLVLDHAGNVHRHGFATDLRSWTLDGEYALIENASARKREKAEERIRECPECSALFSGSRTCPACEYYFAPKGKLVNTMDGELIEIGAQLPALAQDQLEFLCELRGLATQRAYKRGWAAANYRDRYGNWPPRDWEHYPQVQPSDETRRWVQSRLIAYRKARDAAEMRGAA